MNLEPAMPAADQPSRWVDGRKVDKDVVFPLPIMTNSTAATLFFLVIQTGKMDLQAKENIKGILQYIRTSPGTKFPEGPMLVWKTIYTNKQCMAVY